MDELGLGGGEQAHCSGLLQHLIIGGSVLISALFVCETPPQKKNISNSCKMRFLIVFIVVFIVKRAECSHTQYRNSIYSSILFLSHFYSSTVFLGREAVSLIALLTIIGCIALGFSAWR